MPGSVQRLAMFGAVALFPSLLYAQASITGTARDSSGAVVPGVTVEASSPALIEKVRSAVTDGSGQYRIVDLRPGTYVVTFTLTGFAPVKREGIELTGSFVATVNADLQVGSLTETITVSGQTPIVDVQSTQTQRVINNEVIAALPTGRTPMSLATLIPGAVGFLGAQDVGGTDSLGAINGQFSIHGGSNNDMRVMTEGFYTGGNRSGLQFGNNQPNVGSTEEVTIDVAGNTAERSEGGILINFVPKSGGNKYSGLLFVSGTGSGLSGSNLTDRVKDLGFQTDAKVKNTYDINPAFGGPIKQDKLWFFTSARFFGYENYTGMLGNKNAGIANVWTYEPDEGNRLFNKAYSRDVNLRLTYQVNPKHKLSVFWDTQYKCECDQTGNSSFWSKLSGFIVSQEAAPAFYIYPTDTGIVTWSSPLTNRLLIEAGAAYRREDYHVPVRYWRKGDPLLDQINVLDVGQNLVYHGITGGGGPTAAGAFTDSISWTPQFRAALSYVAGAHSLKVGFNDTYLKAHDSNLINSTGTAYLFFSGVPIQVAEKTEYNLAGSVPWDLGIYAQERFTHKRLTLDLGLRYSYFENSSPEQHIGSTLHVPNRNFVLPAATFFSMKDLTPRMGAAYDLFGNGKTALKVGANKYLSAPPPLAGNPATTLISTANRSWNDRTLNAATGVTGNANFVPDCDLTNVVANGECGPLPSSFGQAGSATTFDPATYRGWGVRQYNWEFSGSVQHELVPRVSVDVGYFRRIYGNLQVQYNRALPASAYDVYTVTAPTDPRLEGNSGQVVGPLYDIKPEVLAGGIPTDNFSTTADSLGKMYTRWNGVDVNVTSRLRRLAISGGLSTGRTSIDNCDIVEQVIRVESATVTTTSAGLVPFATSPLYCNQQTKFLTQVKGYAAYTLPGEVLFAATFQSIPGQVLAANVTYTSQQVAASLGRPLSGGAPTVTVNVIPPGTMYGDRLNQLDLRLGKDFRVQRYKINASVDLYNVLNSDAVLNENGAYTATAAVNPWRRPQSLVRPFFVKFGGQVSF
jgi:hypothetical protein